LRVRCLSRGGPGGHCWYPVDWVPLHARFKSIYGARRAYTCCHVPCNTGPCLPAKVGSGAATCPVALNPAFLIGRPPAPPRVPWLRTPPPYKGELRCVTCTVAPDPIFLQRRTPMHHVSYSSGSCLHIGEGSGASHVLQLQILPPYRGGLRCFTCLTPPDPASL
jgi:hypothetical protein